jgi:hypothetical protein
VYDPLARQVRRQRLSTAGAALTGPRRAPISSRVPASLLRGRLFLEIADQQLELLDPLRGATEAGALHERERRSQLLDVQRLDVDLGIARRELTVFGRERLLQGDRERAQGFRIRGQGSGCRRHDSVLTPAQLALLVEAIDWRRTVAPPLPARPTAV